jgi:DinB family
MTSAAHYRMFGHYNAWANRRLFDVAAKLSTEQYRADRGAFFKSVHGTLNHLLVTDRIWMRRFIGEGDAPDRLDAILFETFVELRAAREARTGASSILSISSMTTGSPKPSNIAGSPHRNFSSSQWPRRWWTWPRWWVWWLNQCAADRPRRRRAGTRSVVFSAVVREIRRLNSRKLHCLGHRLRLGISPTGCECSKTVHQAVVDCP